MIKQKVIKASKDYVEIDNYIKENDLKKPLLVCDGALEFLELKNYFENVADRLNIIIIKFDNIQPNPVYESVVEGLKLYTKEGCDGIIAVGGGSVLDTAKAIKLFANLDPNINYLEQTPVPNDILLMAIPTTAGTGSEATRYAAIYYEGNKQSITNTSIIPTTVIVDSSVLRTLPEYQKKATMLDALCHCIESYWSVNSNDESYRYSQEGLKLIIDNFDGYIANNDDANGNMIKAANLAGKAINITQTTAGHAMCYKLTSLYGIAHGHAAALCVAKLWPYMIKNTDKCIDVRGEKYLKSIFDMIATAMGCDSVEEAIDLLQNILYKLELSPPIPKNTDFDILKSSVNPVRLKNFPIALNEETIDELYHQILAPWE